MDGGGGDGADDVAHAVVDFAEGREGDEWDARLDAYVWSVQGERERERFEMLGGGRLRKGPVGGRGVVGLRERGRLAGRERRLGEGQLDGVGLWASGVEAERARFLRGGVEGDGGGGGGGAEEEVGETLQPLFRLEEAGDAVDDGGDGAEGAVPNLGGIETVEDTQREGGIERMLGECGGDEECEKRRLRLLGDGIMRCTWLDVRQQLVHGRRAAPRHHAAQMLSRPNRLLRRRRRRLAVASD